jgi:hypothetical protein
MPVHERIINPAETEVGHVHPVKLHVSNDARPLVRTPSEQDPVDVTSAAFLQLQNPGDRPRGPHSLAVHLRPYAPV